MMAEAQATEEKIDIFDIIKIKNFCASKDIIKKVRSNSQIGRKYLQIIYVIRVLYAEYIKNSYNSTMKRKNSI